LHPAEKLLEKQALPDEFFPANHLKKRLISTVEIVIMD